MGNAHLVPLAHDRDGAAFVLATPCSSPTAMNLLRAGSRASASVRRATSCSSTAV